MSLFSTAPPAGAHPALPSPVRGLRRGIRPHLRAPGPVHREKPHLCHVSRRRAHGRALHGQHAHQVRAMQGGPLHRAVELPAQVPLLQQRLL